MNAVVAFRLHCRNKARSAAAPTVPQAPRVYCDTDFKPRRWWQQRRFEEALSMAASGALFAFLIVALAFISRAA